MLVLPVGCGGDDISIERESFPDEVLSPFEGGAEITGSWVSQTEVVEIIFDGFGFSGTLVTPGWVLTCGHGDPTQWGYDLDQVIVRHGGHTTGVRSTSGHPEFDWQACHADDPVYTWQGDSGGPLFVPSPANPWVDEWQTIGGVASHVFQRRWWLPDDRRFAAGYSFDDWFDAVLADAWEAFDAPAQIAATLSPVPM